MAPPEASRARPRAAPQDRWSPIQRDVALLFGGLALLLASVAVAVLLGVSYAPVAAIEPWAVALLLVAVVAFALGAVWWYQVYPDEREPARGEFTLGEDQRVHEGEGSYRSKAPGPGVLAEPEARMVSEPGYVPRTFARWLLWVGAMVVSLGVAAWLIGVSRTSPDPLSPLLAAMAMAGAAVVLGALAVGEMGHWGRWWRRPGEGA